MLTTDIIAKRTKRMYVQVGVCGFEDDILDFFTPFAFGVSGSLSSEAVCLRVKAIVSKSSSEDSSVEETGDVGRFSK